jgi:cyclopropane-fatty-acyl-phospholipid synthase
MSTAVQTPAPTHSAGISASTVDRSTRLLEQGLLPDRVIRWGIRRLLADRLREEERGGVTAQSEYRRQLIEQLKRSPVAIATSDANEQHYEVPARFFQLALGKRLKYSSGHYGPGCTTLNQAEEDMLRLTVERARIQDGQSILELGCGWGSLTLYMAEHFPNSPITAVSNSNSQREYITGRLQQMGRSGVTIHTCDMNVFDAGQQFDRIVSVEMFEHMRNYETLLHRVSTWMKQDALLFIHIFTHRIFSYPFDVRDASDWMARYFFTGGIMPSDDLLLNFQRDVQIEDHWLESGMHYGHTAHAWLENTDAHKAEILELFENTYASSLLKQQRRAEATKWLVRWRVFFMACEELWKYNGGNEWGVSHYTFRKR